MPLPDAFKIDVLPSGILRFGGAEPAAEESVSTARKGAASLPVVPEIVVSPYVAAPAHPTDVDTALRYAGSIYFVLASAPEKSLPFIRLAEAVNKVSPISKMSVFEKVVESLSHGGTLVQENPGSLDSVVRLQTPAV